MVLTGPDHLAVPSADLQCWEDMASPPTTLPRARDGAWDKEGDTDVWDTGFILYTAVTRKEPQALRH